MHANGSVSYTHVPRIGREHRPHTYYSFTGVVRYEDSKADHGDLRYVMAQQMSLRKAIKKFDSAAREAMIDEIDGILKRGVWTGVLKSNLTEKQRRMILRSSAFLKAKYDLVGNFLKLPYDPCVFRKCTEAGECIVCLYVDDIFSASSSDSLKNLYQNLLPSISNLL